MDAMPEVKALKKKPTTTKLCDIKDQFITRVTNKAADGDYGEVVVLFDEWREESLKEKTRAKRAEGKGNVTTGFDMHDDMCLKKTSMADLLATNQSKTQMASYLAKGLINHYRGNTYVKVVVSYSSKVCTNQPHVMEDDFTSHGHEEADTQIPLHVLRVLRESTYKHIDVFSPDTDVLVLLIDLVSRGHIGALTNIILHAGKYNSPKDIDVVQRVHALGKRKAQGLIGFHNFTGSDYGGKFVGITKMTWCKAYFTLEDDDPILDAFDFLGSFSSQQCCPDANGDFTERAQPLEKFTCMVYDKEAPSTLPEARFYLWSTKSRECENLPPCRATLGPHIQRTNYVCKVFKSYKLVHPYLPDLIDNGWIRDESDVLLPVHCLNPPAPKSFLEMVKCGCKKGDCSKNTCTCRKNDVPCTSLCKCPEDCTNC